MSNSTEVRSLFLSYSTKDSIIADIIERSIVEQLHDNVKISRYTQNVKYKGSFKDFMNTIQEHDFVLTIVSDSYLKSKACMYEVGEILKNHKFREHLIFLVISDDDRVLYKDIDSEAIAANIYSAYGRASYIMYWEEQYKLLHAQLEQIDSLEAKSSLVDALKQLKKILEFDIGPFMEYLNDSFCPKFIDARRRNFADIIAQIFPILPNKFSQCTNLRSLFEEAIISATSITRTSVNQILLCAKKDELEDELFVFASTMPSYYKQERIPSETSMPYKAFVIREDKSASNIKFSPYACPNDTTKSEISLVLRDKNEIIGIFNSESRQTEYFLDSTILDLKVLLDQFAERLFYLGFNPNSSYAKFPYVLFNENDIFLRRQIDGANSNLNFEFCNSPDEIFRNKERFEKLFKQVDETLDSFEIYPGMDSFTFLEKLNFTADEINKLEKSIPKLLKTKILEHANLFAANIQTLILLELKNYKEVVFEYYDMFLMDNSNFIDVFLKHENLEQLRDALLRDISIIEHI